MAAAVPADLDAVPRTDVLDNVTKLRPKPANKRPPTRQRAPAAAAVAASPASPVSSSATKHTDPKPKRRRFQFGGRSKTYAADHIEPSSGEETDGDVFESHTPRSNSKRHKMSKKGHRRVDKETGEVFFKNVKSQELMSAIQMGIRQSIGYVMQRRKRDILVQDFDEVESQNYPREGTSTTPAHHFESFKFSTYAPVAYRFFREKFSIDTGDFLMSMCDSPLRELSNAGASGSLFWLSHDDLFIVKTVQKGESKFLRKLLPAYYLNITQNQRTLLPKFFGHFCYKSASGRHIRFIIMQNILPSNLSYAERYDLKGSTKGRFASEKELTKKNPTLKDIDFIKKHANGLIMSDRTYEQLVGTIERDVRVLESFRIMDYSLLVGLFVPSRGAPSAYSSSSAHQFTVRANASASTSTVHLCTVSGAPPVEGLNLNGVYESRQGRSKDGRFKFVMVQTTHNNRSLDESDDQTDGTSGPSSVTKLYMSFDDTNSQWLIARDPENFVVLANLQTSAMFPNSADAAWQVKDGDHFRAVPAMESRCREREVAVNPIASSNAAASSRMRRRNSIVFQTVDTSDGEDDEQLMNGIPAYNSDGQKVYLYVGIIDILQNYGTRKALEHTYKSMIYDGDTVSVHRPDFYRERFLRFMTDQVFRPSGAASGPGSLHLTHRPVNGAGANANPVAATGTTVGTAGRRRRPGSMSDTEGHSGTESAASSRPPSQRDDDPRKRTLRPQLMTDEDLEHMRRAAVPSTRRHSSSAAPPKHSPTTRRRLPHSDSIEEQTPSDSGVSRPPPLEQLGDALAHASHEAASAPATPTKITVQSWRLSKDDDEDQGDELENTTAAGADVSASESETEATATGPELGENMAAHVGRLPNVSPRGPASSSPVGRGASIPGSPLANVTAAPRAKGEGEGTTAPQIAASSASMATTLPPAARLLLHDFEEDSEPDGPASPTSPTEVRKNEARTVSSSDDGESPDAAASGQETLVADVPLPGAPVRGAAKQRLESPIEPRLDTLEHVDVDAVDATELHHQDQDSVNSAGASSQPKTKGEVAETTQGHDKTGAPTFELDQSGTHSDEDDISEILV
ncbi:uncharacterized protein MONBRDRAFT_25486 [Monosiga brevicollis MX1]|uniref:PIPK domain-containing protein n=1 Tax=Monosiga brevicollis TaxID=81824 RepID=A9UZJ9_MONBE|nr:uncharacterized protein MONBRDRAFT_25486 [Monosiga brevicollis MX1]EDQ89244.1 predicted protein [Monosiga brevicollis MX1]|eukprot:XP_001745820.1 hypothetical protein [Monosiga brevicollis MX1]